MATNSIIGRIWLGNGGQIVLQTETYQHSYESERQAAEDVGSLLESKGDTSGWDGNEDERVDFKAEHMDDNGNSVIVIADDDTAESLAGEIHETGGGAARKLAQMLAPSNY
jgi:hypothetical protein